jgi:hypothetical protein
MYVTARSQSGDSMFNLKERSPILVAAAAAIILQPLRAVPAHAGQAEAVGATSANVEMAVKQAATSFMASSCHVGLSMAVVNGNIPRFYNFGSAFRGRSLLPTPDSLYEIAGQVVLYPDQHEGYVMLANDTCAGTESALGDIATAVHASLNPTTRPTGSLQAQ